MPSYNCSGSNILFDWGKRYSEEPKDTLTSVSRGL